MKAYELKVELVDVDEKTIRYFVIPAGISFVKLHGIIQTVMGWWNEHQYEFTFNKMKVQITSDTETIAEYKYLNTKAGQKRLTEVIAQNLVSSGREFKFAQLSPHRLLIDEYIEAEKEFEYLYDFGDRWLHKIKLVKTHDDYKAQCPQVIKLIGQCPEENSRCVVADAEPIAKKLDPKCMKAFANERLKISYPTKH